MRANLTRVSDAAEWWQVVTGPVSPLIDDPEFIATATALLPPEPFSTTTWSEWTGAVKAATGRKGKDLFLPLRRALTGHSHGPELAALLPLIGRDRALVRLRRENS